MAKKRELDELAVGQWGLVTTAQARSVGVTAQAMAKMARAGDLVRLAHGVYRLAGSPIDEQEELRAAWLGLDATRTADERIADSEVDVVSHQSAARVRGLGDLDADIMEFTVPRRRQTRRADVRFHRGPVAAQDWSLVGGLPVTTALRTIDDLAARRIDRGHLAHAVRDALWLDQGMEDELARRLVAHARTYGSRSGDGRGLLQVMLHEAGGRVVQGASMADAFRGVDPALMRAIAPYIDAAVVREIALRLDADVVRAIASRFDAEFMRAILPHLNADAARLIAPQRGADPAVEHAVRDANVEIDKEESSACD